MDCRVAGLGCGDAGVALRSLGGMGAGCLGTVYRASVHERACLVVASLQLRCTPPSPHPSPRCMGPPPHGGALRQGKRNSATGRRLVARATDSRGGKPRRARARILGRRHVARATTSRGGETRRARARTHRHGLLAAERRPSKTSCAQAIARSHAVRAKAPAVKRAARPGTRGVHRRPRRSHPTRGRPRRRGRAAKLERGYNEAPSLVNYSRGKQSPSIPRPSPRAT